MEVKIEYESLVGSWQEVKGQPVFYSVCVHRQDDASYIMMQTIPRVTLVLFTLASPPSESCHLSRFRPRTVSIGWKRDAVIKLEANELAPCIVTRPFNRLRAPR